MNDNQPCGQCKHPFSSHNRNIRGEDTMRVDDALLNKHSQYDVNTDKPPGQSGCRECSCSAWRAA